MRKDDIYEAFEAVSKLIIDAPETLSPDVLLKLGMFFGEVSNLLVYQQVTCAFRECDEQATMIVLTSRMHSLVEIPMCERHYRLDQRKDDV